MRVNGTRESRIENVRLKNVRLKLGRWTKYAGGVYDNRPTKVLTPIEAHETDGFNLRNADKVTVENCSVNWAEDCPGYFQNALATEAVTDLQIKNFKGDSAAHPMLRN